MPKEANPAGAAPRAVTIHYLEMTSPAELRPKKVQRADVQFTRVDPVWPELNRFFYTGVGGPYYWVDRLLWSREQWLEHLRREGHETWVLATAGLPAGYAELERRGVNVEIAYFGLLPRFTGQGLGAHLLTCTVEQAWTPATRRVWLHTCSLDHAAALPNYFARGFRLFREETIHKVLPARVPGVWA